jgi:hypothetical protein
MKLYREMSVTVAEIGGDAVVLQTNSGPSMLYRVGDSLYFSHAIDFDGEKLSKRLLQQYLDNGYVRLH